MLYDGKIWIGTTDDGERAMLLPKMANRHGLIAGATGTGKTITLKVMAESFSDLGVPVFFADVKGDLAATMFEGKDSEDMQRRIEKFGLEEAGWDYDSYPTTLYDLFGKNGIPLRTTISEMGAPLLSRILDLNNLQTDLMSVAFKIADDQDLLLVDTKDLKALLNYMGDNNKEFAAEYGNIAKNSIGAMLRAIVALESEGGDQFFGEPGINIHDWFTTSRDGKGMISILDSQTLINNGRLYSTFLLWMLSELFETLPEVGDLDKPKMVFFFDEAHLLFSGTSKALLDKIEQVVKLVRSKGVGVYFVTQNPRDVPDNVLAQLNTKIEHGLRAYTPAEQRAVKAAAQAFRENPAFNTYETILALGTGEAVISYLGADGIPTVAQKVNILPPQSRMGSIMQSRAAFSTPSIKIRLIRTLLMSSSRGAVSRWLRQLPLPLPRLQKRKRPQRLLPQLRERLRKPKSVRKPQDAVQPSPSAAQLRAQSDARSVRHSAASSASSVRPSAATLAQALVVA